MADGRYAYGGQSPFNQGPGGPGFPSGVSEMPSGYNAYGSYGNDPYPTQTSDPPYAYPPPQPTPQPQYVTPDRYPEKPPPLAPVAFAAVGGAGAGAGMGMPLKEKTICGMRRKVFFIILGVVLVLIIAGLAAGLAIALTRKNNNSGNSQSAGAGGSGSTSSSTTPRTSNPLTPVVESTPISEPPSQPTFEPTTEEPFTTEDPATSTTEPETTEEPTSTEEPETTEEPTSTEEPISSEFTEPTTTPEDTPTTTPEPSSTPPSDGLISETTPSGPNSTPSRPPTPTISSFALETGFNTLAVVITSTTGNADLCSLLIQSVAATTAFYPLIDGSPEDLYTAYWAPDGFTGTLTATGIPPEPTAEYQFWGFEATWSGGSAGECVQSGADSFALEQSGVAIYSSGFTFTSQCAVGSYEFESGDFCYIYWVGAYVS